MNDFAEYMELIVEPTFEDFQRNGGSVRHAYLACPAIYHAVDRAAYPDEASALAEQWRKDSLLSCSLKKWRNTSSTVSVDGRSKRRRKIRTRCLSRIRSAWRATRRVSKLVRCTSRREMQLLFSVRRQRLLHRWRRRHRLQSRLRRHAAASFWFGQRGGFPLVLRKRCIPVARPKPSREQSRGRIQAEQQIARGHAPRLAPMLLAFDAFVATVSQPPNVMPPYADRVISRDDLESIYAYLRSIPAPPSLDAIPALRE